MNADASNFRDQKRYSTDPAYHERMARDAEANPLFLLLRRLGIYLRRRGATLE